MAGRAVWLKREDLLPHRRAQDQQRARPGAARPAHGQAARDRRDRAPASTASPPPPRARCSGSTASSTWAPRTCERQAPNVLRMRLLGAEVRAGRRRAAARSRTRSTRRMRDWVTNVRTTHYILGSVLGPASVSRRMVRDFQRVIGEEARAADRWRATGGCPTAWSPAWAAARTRIGLFYDFLGDREVRLIGVEAGGRGRRARRARGALASGGALGVLHGTRHATCCRTRTARSQPTHSISAGLDYPAVGPEHACCTSAARHVSQLTDDEALAAFAALLAQRGHPARAREGARASPAMQRGPRRSRRTRVVLVNLSGRGDKDVQEVLRVEREGLDG